MRMHRRAGCLMVLLLCAAAAQAQVVGPSEKTELQRVLAKLGEEAVELERSLPSFTCEESVVSQEVREGKVKRKTTFTMTLRAHKESNGSLKESFQVTSVNGKPFTEGTFQSPVFISGDFDGALRYFHPDQQICYDFELSQGQVNFRSSLHGPHECEVGLTGFARLDAAGRVTYVERTVPAETAKPLKLATYAAVTFAPVTMGDKTYRLSSHMVAEKPQGKSMGRFEASYTDCRLFTSSVTIGPAEMLPEASAAPK